MTFLKARFAALLMVVGALALGIATAITEDDE